MNVFVHRLIEAELKQGFSVISDASWLNREEWRAIVVSQDRKYVRLVLLDANEPGKGTFTRLIDGICRVSLTPVIVEPNEILIAWCRRHDFRMRKVGSGELRHHIWYPRRWH